MTIANESGGKALPVLHHSLKVWPEFIPALEDGSKTFEARQDDRCYQVGDTLRLYGYDPATGLETGWRQQRKVTYKLTGPGFGVEAGHCILGLSPLAIPQEDGAREGVQRYEPAVDFGTQGTPFAAMDRRKTGDYVLHADHMAEVARLRAERDEAMAVAKEAAASETRMSLSLIKQLERAMDERDEARTASNTYNEAWTVASNELGEARAELSASSILIGTLRQDVAKAVAHGEVVRAELAEARLLTKRWLALQGWMGDGHDEEEEACMKSARAFLSDGGGQ